MRNVILRCRLIQINLNSSHSKSIVHVRTGMLTVYNE